ncbi:hypothetical protein J3R82DRAFT_12020 [Butyriboletus roseoflavus]|nr:hypothetical protein J3R82DRAFT_12020 [Butyriboletus roseoflavus]
MPPVPGPQWSMGQIQPSPSATSAVKAIPDGSIHDDTPRAHDPSEVASSGQINANLPLVSPSTNTPQELSENIPPTIPPKPQPKRTRRAELSEELIARDLDWFKSNQAVVKEDPSVSSSIVTESSPALASDTPHLPRLSLSQKKKTARMVPSRRLPRRLPLNATQEVESGVSASALPPSELSAEEVGSFENAEDVQMDVDEQNPSLERVNFDVRSAAIPEAHDVQDVSRKEETPPEPQLVPISSNEHSTGPKIMQTDGQPPLVEAPFLNGESRISARPPVPPLETTLDRMEGTDILTSDLRSEKSESPSKSEPTPPQSPEMFELRTPILPPLVNALAPPLNLNFRIPRILLGQPQQSEMDAIQRRFDDDMTVIHSAQGKPFTYTHMIDISLKESSFSKISKWINRKYHPSEASQGVCISLACYRLSEFFDRIKSESGKHEIEELTSQSSCSWPYPNRLSLHVNNEERQTIIPLSPPLFVVDPRAMCRHIITDEARKQHIGD